MPSTLVIVESPAKARTFAAILGDGYHVVASAGHVRDLPRSAAEIPASDRSRLGAGPGARLAVDVDGDFRPVYVVPTAARRRVAALRHALRDADAVVLATDGDREGEAIAWHCCEVLRPDVPVRRMVVHEITPEAVRAALASTRALDTDLVAAQETRRILDRLVGWQLSALLWRTVAPKLSAGRVQSVVLRMLVERERERMAFVAGDCWRVDAHFAGDTGDQMATALTAVDGTAVATVADCDPRTGGLRRGVRRHRVDAADARRFADACRDADATVTAAASRAWRRRPPPAFTTATLQQAAGRRFGWPAERTMRVAQDLYERGWITYPRTDATSLASTFVRAAREWARREHGPDAVPPRPRAHRTSASAAQEAHEAVRPAGTPLRPPTAARRTLRGDAARLYELVWARAIASQMRDAVGRESTVTLRVRCDDGTALDFTGTDRRTDEPGWLRCHGVTADAAPLPLPAVGDRLRCGAATAVRETSRPPARWTEPALVAELERRGVGRPSTYASTLATLYGRDYAVTRSGDDGTELVPTWTAFAVTAVLEAQVPELVDTSFTASMEATLDAVAAGTVDPVPWLRAFWSGDDDGFGLRARTGTAADARRSGDLRTLCSVRVGTGADGGDVTVRVGRRGVTVQHGDATAGLPATATPDDCTPERLARLVTLPRVVGDHDGVAVEALIGRNGPFLRHGDTTRDLPSEDAVFTIGLDEAVAILDAPRAAGPKRRRAPVTLGDYGVDPVTGRTVHAMLGRFGPYVSDGTTNATIPRGRDPVSLRLDDALALLRAKAAAGGSSTPRDTPRRKRRRAPRRG